MAASRRRRRREDARRPPQMQDSSEWTGVCVQIFLGLLVVLAAMVMIARAPLLDAPEMEMQRVTPRQAHRALKAWNFSSNSWATDAPSTSAGSAAATAATTAPSSTKTTSTDDQMPTENANEPTFLGLFKTAKLFSVGSLAIPAAFLVYKIGLFIYYWITYRSYSDKHNYNARGTAASTSDRDEDEHAGSYHEQKPQGHGHGHHQDGKLATPSDCTTALLESGAANSTAEFWIDEELQPWRIPFQRIEIRQRLTPVLEEDARGSTSIGSSESELDGSDVWLGMYHDASSMQPVQQRVALKWIAARTHSRESRREKMKEEIKRMTRLRHPNVVALIGIAWSPETALIAVTEYMARGELRQWLHRSRQHEAGRWTPHKLQILLDIADVLVYLHALTPPLLHGNCNSRNVLLNEQMQAKLSDFGVPREFVAQREIGRYTSAGSGRWMSPEALMGRDGAEYVSIAMDVYALGVLMVEMDTHELPFADLLQADRSQMPEPEILELIANGALTPTLSPTCPPRIVQLIEACMAYNPCKRPTAEAVASSLRSELAQVKKAFAHKQAGPARKGSRGAISAKPPRAANSKATSTQAK